MLGFLFKNKENKVLRDILNEINDEILEPLSKENSPYSFKAKSYQKVLSDKDFLEKHRMKKGKWKVYGMNTAGKEIVIHVDAETEMEAQSKAKQQGVFPTMIKKG